MQGFEDVIKGFHKAAAAVEALRRKAEGLFELSSDVRPPLPDVEAPPSLSSLSGIELAYVEEENCYFDHSAPVEITNSRILSGSLDGRRVLSISARYNCPCCRRGIVLKIDKQL